VKPGEHLDLAARPQVLGTLREVLIEHSQLDCPGGAACAGIEPSAGDE
jgi:hypothetical protein